MKTRQGFVSNSSSSSFIVGFHKMPKCVEDVEKQMFTGPTLVEYYDIGTMTSHEVATRVFNDIKGGSAKKLNKKTATKSLLEGSFPGEPPYDYNKETESDKIRDAYQKETGKEIFDDAADPEIQKLYNKALRAESDQNRRENLLAAKAFIEGFWPSVKGKKVFLFHYSDNNGEATLEHGNIFYRLPHVRISQH